jgi:hypothetical protein
VWYLGRPPRSIDAAVAVLTRAREFISDEPRWCKRAFALTWLDLPVIVGSRYARRFCALGAIKRAGRELGLPVNQASRALEWQTVRPFPGLERRQDTHSRRGRRRFRCCPRRPAVMRAAGHGDLQGG